MTYPEFAEDLNGEEDEDFTRWRSRDGRVHRIKDMEDAHLENTIRLLAVRGAASSLAVFNHTATTLEETEHKLNPLPYGYIKVYANMLREQQSRRDRAHNSEAAESAAPRKGSKNHQR